MFDDATPLSSDTALFLDFDGTLAPIGDDPDAVYLPPDEAEMLITLADQLGGALVIISGRDIRDLAARTPDRLWRIGGHGLDICAPGALPSDNDSETLHHAAPDAMRARLLSVAETWEGVRVEDKGPVLAVHYRAAPNAGGPLADQCMRIISDYDGYIMQHGKMVIEAKPGNANKGAALSGMLTREGFTGRTPIMVGDDVTDEDAMTVALRSGGSAIKVGDGPTVAPTRLPGPDAVWQWLKQSVAL